jgi:hypothetical protein
MPNIVKTDLENVLDYNTFLNTVRLSDVLTSNAVMMYFAKYLLQVFDVTSQQNVSTFVNSDFQNGLADFIIQVHVAARLTVSSQQKLNVSQISYLTSHVYAILNGPIDWSDMSSIKDQLLRLPASLFSFGSNFSTYGTVFNLANFQERFVDILMDTMYPSLYFKHITDRATNCQDFKCKRIYLLTKYLFVYYTFMNVFLSIFSSATTVQTCKNDTGMTSEDLETLKYQLVVVMDGVLSLMQNENMLDVPGANQVSSISQYYTQIKNMSNGNILKSNYLNEKKETAEVLRNNLTNYTKNEILSYERFRKERREFIATLLVMFVVVSFLVGLLVTKSYKAMFASSAIVLLGLAINGLAAVIPKKPTQL